MNSILLTGANGFIGKHLIQYLEEHHSPFLKNLLLSGSKTNLKYDTILTKNYHFASDSLHNKKIDYVIHLGAFIPKQSSEANLINKTTSNITSTLSLLEHLPKTVKKFIFISTIDVYGITNKVINESLVPKPISLYGHSKLYCERMVEEWGKKNNILIQILRIGHVYGTGEEKYHKIIPVTMQRILKGDTIQLFGEGKDIRSFIFITDVIQAIMNAIKLESYSGVTNIVGQEQITISELVYKIITIANRPTNIENINSVSKTRDLIFDNIKMKELLHKPKVGLDEGLRKEWDYMQKLAK